MTIAGEGPPIGGPKCFNPSCERPVLNDAIWCCYRCMKTHPDQPKQHGKNCGKRRE